MSALRQLWLSDKSPGPSPPWVSITGDKKYSQSQRCPEAPDVCYTGMPISEVSVPLRTGLSLGTAVLGSVGLTGQPQLRPQSGDPPACYARAAVLLLWSRCDYQ